jgi:hypothetical protein
LYHIGCVISGTKRKEIQKICKRKGASRLEGGGSLEKFQIVVSVWMEYVQHMMFERFVRRSHSCIENWNQCVHNSVTTHISGFVLFISHVKRMEIFFFNYIYFLFFKKIYLTNNTFLPATVL